MRLETLEPRQMLTTMAGFSGFGPTIDGPEGEPGGSGPSFVPDQLLMRFQPGVSDAQRQQILESEGASILKTYRTFPVVLVDLPDFQSDVIGAADFWNAKAEVKYAEPNYIKQFSGVPNDPRFSEQWAHQNTGQSGGVADADIDTVEAWDVFTGSPTTVVAIIDSGIDYTHPDLVNNMWTNPGEIPGDGVDNDANGYIDDVYGIDAFNDDSDPQDDVDHGTHVAGISGADGNNGIGVSGVNQVVQLMAVKIGGPNGIPTADAIEGIDYVTMMKSQFGINIVVSNNSWGGTGFSQAEYDAVTAHTAADIIFVAAAGNDTADNDAIPHYPANFDHPLVISVASTDDGDQLSSFSDWGLTTVDLGAPGSSILSTIPNNNYAFFDGTSMASPAVAGAVGLVRGLAPAFTGQETKQLIMDTVDLIPSLAGKTVTGGRLNVAEAINRVKASKVQGRVWSDENSNALPDAGEQGIENWTVFVDLNNNGALDSNEPSGVTIADGTYEIEMFAGPGDYTVAQVLQPLWEQTFPASGTHTITIVNRDDVISGIDFGNRPVRGGASGVKWHDIDADGIRDVGEPGMPGIYIYADLDKNGSIALGEPAAITDANGNYNIQGIPPGTGIQIREVLNPGWVISYPALGYHEVTIDPAATTPNVDFGNATNLDFGDAPTPYPTLGASGGPSHGVLPGFQLGLLIDGELDGQPELNAVGDDLSSLADEDGVAFPAALFSGKNATVDVTVNTGPYSPGVLQGWVDFNADGDWSDPGEQIVKDLLLDDGTHTLTFAVPAGSAVGPSFARFRYGYERGIGTTGAAMAGEVEDHGVLILKDEPVANDDNFDVPQDSINYSLDVMANDFPSSTGVLQVVGVTQPDHGSVTIAPDGQSVLFTPNRGIFSPPNEVFTYTIGDGTGNSDTATVTVFVQPELIEPVAVDDAYRVVAGSANNALHVLDNDLAGILGTFQLMSVGTPGNGTATIDNNGTPGDPLDDFIVYNPGAGFSVMDQFQYTIGNANGTSTGTVSIFEDPDPGTQGLEISLELTDPIGNPVTQVAVGEEFVLIASVRDRRTAASATGVAAAYMDVLFNRNLVQPNVDPSNPLGFDITFSADYLNAKSGSARLPGILDEVGSFQTGGSPLGSTKLELFEVAFTATGVGQVDFMADPADLMPAHDSLFFDPPAAVPLTDISYGFSSLLVTGGGVLGGNTLDVNVDGHVSPLDALLVINNLNSAGGFNAAGGSGGSRLDVNRDLAITPLDALLVVNYLNQNGSGEGESGFQSVRSGQAKTMPALPLADVVEQPAQRVVRTSLFAIDHSLDPAVDSWSLQIGEQSDTGARPAADAVVDDALDSLLDDLAADVQDAWKSDLL